jgi:tetratricopeptide (TPR) repeat protein
MDSSRSLLCVLGLFVSLTLGLATLAASRYAEPFPPLATSLSSSTSQLSDFAGIAMGFRKLTADLAWVQTLIYYGTNEAGVDPEEAENGGGSYPLFLSYCQRVARIDPSFKYVYYYGGSVLGWNLKRLDEAVEFLKEGVQAHPKEWRFQQFLAGLAYQKSSDINHLTEFLESFTQVKDSPNIMRCILANLYKKQKRYKDSIRIWMIIYDTGDPNNTAKALSEIREMAPLAHIDLKK